MPRKATRSKVPANRSQLQQIIAGLSEGVILIETDHTITYVNDAALLMHGVTRIEELGRTVDEYRHNFVLRYRNDHALVEGQYPVDRLVAGEAFDDVQVVVARSNDLSRDWTHSIRSLIINDRNGDPDCLVLIIHDASARIEAEERFERAFRANPAPALICRLSDLRFIKMNEGFRQLTGYRREDVLGRSIYEVDVLENAERREYALQRLRAGETITQMEASLTVPSDPGGRLVVVAGQPIEIGDAPCMLFTFADLEPRRKAETALRDSEERFAKAFRLIPVPTAILSADDSRFVEVNDAFKGFFGYQAQDVIGQTPADLHLWPDEGEQGQFRSELAKAGSLQGYEARLSPREGPAVTCLIAAETVSIGGQCCILTVFQDISSRKRSEEDLVQAIEAVMADASWFSQGVVEKLAALRQPARPAGIALAGMADLTAREREILGLVCQGQSDEEIAIVLGVARNTVRNHIAALFRKLGVNRRSALIVWARERGVGGEGVDARPQKRRRPSAE